MAVQILLGDCREILPTLPDESVQCCVTSPPYWGLRDYGVDGQIGLERTPDEYVAQMVAVFREVRRVLREDGTLWLNLGDSYNAYNGNRGNSKSISAVADESRPIFEGAKGTSRKAGCGNSLDLQGHSGRSDLESGNRRVQKLESGLVDASLKPKDLVGIPWRVAFALQADGWYLRSDIIWSKPNPMPESVRDRPTKSHEYVFLLAKSERYWYDADAVSEPSLRAGDINGGCYGGTAPGRNVGRGIRPNLVIKDRRNLRSVWTVATEPYSGAHFATFPRKLIEPCILAGCPVGGTVIDPFAGSGTVGEVCEVLGRNSILIELNPDYVKLQEHRTAQQGLFCGGEHGQSD